MKFYLLLILITATKAQASCQIQGPRMNGGDILRRILETAVACPASVQELKELFGSDGLSALPAMVANRGFHNPKQGSFSIFESVKGYSRSLNLTVLPEHLYFGHFTGVNSKNEVVLDQAPAPNKLLIEAIAYDFLTGVYNFYELIGTSQGPVWFFRGNSVDAFEDNKFLKLGPPNQFGTRMRCSACHNSGGPIMKEISFPHNDWWTKTRGLPFGKNKASAELQKYLGEFVDASEFSKSVARGMQLLQKRNISAGRSLKEKLKPLFCSTEINLESTPFPLSAPTTLLEISSESFVDPLLVKPAFLKMSKELYARTLNTLGSKFPETTLLDADHAFLSPVRAKVHHMQVRELINQRVIDEEFALDVLSVDFMNPLFSSSRCELLKLIPEVSQWRVEFKVKLLSMNTTHSIDLGRKLETVDGPLHKKRAEDYLKRKQAAWADPKSVRDEVLTLFDLRLSVFKDSISQNPKGQILEPGFRVIFPVLH